MCARFFLYYTHVRILAINLFRQNLFQNTIILNTSAKDINKIGNASINIYFSCKQINSI